MTEERHGTGSGATIAAPDRPVEDSALNVPRFGVGLQFNPALMGWFPFLDQPLDALEVLFDSVMTPLDGPGVMSPGMAEVMREAAARFPIIGHSNYGGDFGFDDLMSTPAV